jgi:hypothetical protein
MRIKNLHKLFWNPGSSRYWLGVSLILAGLMLYLYYFYPGQQIGPVQPIPFSHRVHAGVKQISCRFCHPFVNRSQRAGLPSLEKCFFCHKYIIPMHPQLVKEKEHYDREIPVPWVRIFFVPDYVKFRHQPHIVLGKLQCGACHGDVAAMDRLQSVNFQMGFCIGCHKKMKAQLDCWLACHH